jgi:hypothetical protein
MSTTIPEPNFNSHRIKETGFFLTGIRNKHGFTKEGPGTTVGIRPERLSPGSVKELRQTTPILSLYTFHTLLTGLV